MKFFIDTANLAQIKEAQDMGVLDGVTTNPSLMAKEGIKGQDNIMKHYVDICNAMGIYSFGFSRCLVCSSCVGGNSHHARALL